MSDKTSAQQLAKLDEVLRNCKAVRESIRCELAKLPAKKPKILTLDDPTMTDIIVFGSKEEKIKWEKRMEVALREICY